MALRFRCSACGQLYRVPDSMGGRTIHCFSCGQAVIAATRNRVADDAPVDQAAGEVVIAGPSATARTQEEESLDALGLELVDDTNEAQLELAADDDALPGLKDEPAPARAKPLPASRHTGASTAPAAGSRSGPSAGTSRPATTSTKRPPQKTRSEVEPLSLADIASAAAEESMACEQAAAVGQTPVMYSPAPAPRQKSQIAANVARGVLESVSGLSKALDFLGAWFTRFYLIAVPIFIIGPWPLLAYNRSYAGLLLFVGIYLSIGVLTVSWIVCSLKIPGLWPGGWIGYLSTFIGIGLIGGIIALRWPPALALTQLVASLVWLGFVVQNWDRIAWKCGRWLVDCIASIVCLLMILAIAYIFPRNWIADYASEGPPSQYGRSGGWSAQQTNQSGWQSTPVEEPSNRPDPVRTSPAPDNRITQRPAPIVSNPGPTNTFDNPPVHSRSPNVTPPRPIVTERPVPGVTDPAPTAPTPDVPTVARPVAPDAQPTVVTERPLPGATPTPPVSPGTPPQVTERTLPGAAPAVSPPPKDPAAIAKPAPGPAPVVTPPPTRPPVVVDTTPVGPAGQLSKLGAEVKANADEDITAVDLRGASNVVAAAKILAGVKNIPVLRLLPSQFTPDAIAALKTIPSITRLEFSDVKLADADLARVAALSNVDELNLAGQPITSAGIRALAPMPNLKRLYLKGTKIDDSACQHLAKITSLRYLDVSDTHLTSDGALQLKPLKSLVGLVLTHTDVSDAAQETLKAAIPRLNIIPP